MGLRAPSDGAAAWPGRARWRPAPEGLSEVGVVFASGVAGAERCPAPENWPAFGVPWPVDEIGVDGIAPEFE